MTTDFIVREMERQRLEFFRLNAEDIACYRVVIPDGDPANLRLEFEDRKLELSTVRSAYYRRPQAPTFDEYRRSTAEYLQAEWSAILRTIWNALEGRWLNSPFSILRAEDKPRQLSLAKRSGFKVPETLVTNHFGSATAFGEQSSVVAKPLRHALINDGEAGRVIFTSRIDTLDKANSTGIEMAPIIFQQEIPKKHDVRVIVVDKQVFAAAIHSQEREETSTDWRKGVRMDLEHRSIGLPQNVAQACVSITKSLGLRYSAIDLVEASDGEFWFLEANPNGQWAWIEQRTGAPISAALVQAFLR